MRRLVIFWWKLWLCEHDIPTLVLLFAYFHVNNMNCRCLRMRLEFWCTHTWTILWRSLNKQNESERWQAGGHGLSYLGGVGLGKLHTCCEHIRLWLSALIKLCNRAPISTPIILTTHGSAKDVIRLQLLGHDCPELGVTQRGLHRVEFLILSELFEKLIQDIVLSWGPRWILSLLFLLARARVWLRRRHGWIL